MVSYTLKSGMLLVLLMMTLMMMIFSRREGGSRCDGRQYLPASVWTRSVGPDSCAMHPVVSRSEEPISRDHLMVAKLNSSQYDLSGC